MKGLLFIEVGPPFQRRPGIFRSDIMTRVWWGWFAIAWSPLSLDEYTAREPVWRDR